MKLKPWVKVLLFLIFLGLVFTYIPEVYDYLKQNIIPKKITKNVDKVLDKINILKKDDKEYKACLAKPFTEEELTENLQNKKSELDSYIYNNYRASVRYEDLNTGFSYSYKPDEVYYAASTIKLLDGLYIYTKAQAGELSLDETVTYKSSDNLGASKGMKNHAIGEEISLRTLVKYAIIYSDNSAHQMLVKYIGFSNLKAFGNSLGAKNTLVGGDNFGNIDVNDAIIYLKNTYDFIRKYPDLGNELKSFMLEAEENALKYDGLNAEVAHKYGEYDSYFHDIGIVYDENPYVVAVLTTHGKGNFISVVSDISKHINDLHQEFINERKANCEQYKN